MKALICRVLGHHWRLVYDRPARYYTCTRCHEPGFWVPS